jgi:hypothetical protein
MTRSRPSAPSTSRIQGGVGRTAQAAATTETPPNALGSAPYPYLVAPSRAWAELLHESLMCGGLASGKTSTA